MAKQLNILISAVALLLGLSSFAQSYRLFLDHHLKPAGIKVFESGVTEHFKFGESTPYHLTLPGKNNSIDVVIQESRDCQEPEQYTSESLQYIEPGLLPEADLIRDAAYTPDGDRIAVIYQHSGNIAFYDSQTYEVLNVTDLGIGPIDLVLGTDHAYVACRYSKEIYMINLNDYSISGILTLDRQPSQIEVSPDESVLYIAFPSYMDGSVAAYSASSHELLFELPELFIHHFGYYGFNGRMYYQYYRFCLSEDGNFLTGTSDLGTVIIFNAKTGLEMLRWNDRFFCGFSTSVTSDTLYLLSLDDDDLIYLYRLQANDFTKIDSITRPVSEMYFGQDDLAVSGDGNRVLTQDSWNDAYLLFDFTSMSTSAYSVNSFLLQLINMSYDRKYTFCQNESTIKIFDMDNPGFISTFGHSAGYFGMASTVSYKYLTPTNQFVLNNSYYRFDEFCVIDFQYPNSIGIDTCLIAGALPEADMTTAACLSGDGIKLVSANFLSANVSLIDVNTQELENMFDIDNISTVTPIPGSVDVLLSGPVSDATYLFNTKNAFIEKTINVSQAWSVTVSEDGQYAYAIDVTGMLFKIALDNENTHLEGYVDVNFFQNNLLIMDLTDPLESKPRTKPGLSPDGKWLLASTQDNIQGPLMHIVETESMTILKSLPIGNKATYDMAFTGDSRRACVASGSNIAQIIYLDGVSSYVESEVISNSGNSFLAAAYNNTTRKFILGSKGMLNEVVPETGQITASTDLQNEWILQIAADQNGLPMVRGQRKFFHGEETFNLPGCSEPFAYDTTQQLVVIPIPGPDRICLYNPLVLEMREIPGTGGGTISVNPNPACDFITIRSANEISRIEVFGLEGGLVYSKAISDSEIKLSIRELPSGMYFLKASTAGGMQEAKFAVIH